MSQLVVNPPITLIDMLELGTAEVTSAPVQLWAESGAGRVFDFVELQVSLFGDLTTAGGDVLIKKYRAPLGNAEHTDRAAVATENIVSNAGGNMGSERIANGNFAVTTGWNADRWSIATGVATHSGSASRLSRDMTALTAGGHLMRATVTNVGTGSWRFRGFIEGAKLPTERVDFIDETALPAGTSAPFKFARYVPALPALTSNENLRAFFEVNNEGFVIDDVSLKQCNPYRQTSLMRFSDVGSGVVFGFLPSADMTGVFMTAEVRRYRGLL